MKASNSEHTREDEPLCIDLMTKVAADNGPGAKGRGVELEKRVGLQGLSP